MARPVRPSSVPRLDGSTVTGFGLLLAAVAMLAVAGVLGFQAATWDRILPGVVALGTPIGGVAPQDAVARLNPHIDTLLSRPLQLRFRDRVWNTTARELGLRLDPADLAQEAYRIGREGNPLARLGAQLDTLANGRQVSVSSRTDQAALEASLARIAREIDRPPTDARLAFVQDGTVQHTEAQIGLVMDVPTSRQRVAQALASATPQVELAVREVQPTIGNDLVQPAREQLERIVGGGQGPSFTLTFGQQTWKLERADIVRLLSVEGGTRPGEKASVRLDDRPLHALVQRVAKELDQEVRDARFGFNNGSLRVLRESKDGRQVDQTAAVALLRASLLAGERTAALPVKVTKPAVSSENPAALGIVERIERGETSFAGSIPEKQHNIRLAAERLNGVVVPPGGTFSFNKEVGPTTLEAGFKWGFGITGGGDGARTVPSVAGGICQVATTLFHPVFWGGYQLEERYWHLYWIPAYTSRGVVGLDVTVDEDSRLDFKWVNPTDSYVLIQSATDDEKVYFALYGKKPAWTVKVDDPVITNRTPPDPKPVAQEEPSLPWGRVLQVETAREGFDVLLTRRVIPPEGGEPRVLQLKSTYQPSRTVTLVGTANKPANEKVEDAIARVLATPTPAATRAPQIAPTPQPTARPAQTAAPAPAAPTANPTAAPTPPRPQPTPTTAVRVEPAPKPPAPQPTRTP